MARSSRQQTAVNRISFEELKEIIGPEFETAIRTGIADYFSQIGLVVAEAIIAGEVEQLCGPKHARKATGKSVRWGSQPGTIKVRGTNERINKPRVRTADGKHEIELKTYQAFSDKDALREDAIARVGNGVSTRNYVRTVRKELGRHGISKSSISRHVIASTQDALAEFNSRRLEGKTFVALLIDGVHLGKTHAVAAIGIDKSGYKHVLGWQIGSTEHSVVCRDLLRRLVEMGLDPDAPYLFVVDGSKALKLAIEERFGAQSMIQRCQEHKIRDVEGYLPRKLRKRFRVKIQAAYNELSYKAASDRLQKIRLELLSVSEPAANSLTEGLEHTLTLHRLGIAGGVRESLRTTNIIESAFARLRERTRNVSNWQDLAQVDRWLAFGLLKVESGFRRLHGFRQLTRLQRKVQTALQTR